LIETNFVKNLSLWESLIWYIDDSVVAYFSVPPCMYVHSYTMEIGDRR